MIVGHVNNTIADGQRRDCTIRALSSLCNMPYAKVELVLAVGGKDDNRGFDIYKWLDRHNGRVLGCQFTLVRRHQYTGRFMLGNKRHVQALIDGVVHDYAPRGISYRWCYEVKLGCGSDDTTRKLEELAARGIHTMSELRVERQKLFETL